VSDDPITWYLANRPLLMGYLRLMASHEVVEDALQETYLVLQRTGDRYLLGSDPGSWVRGIARNVVKQVLTKHGRLRSMPMEALIESLDQAVSRAEPDDLVASSDLEHLSRCVSQLDERQQDLLRQRYHQGLSLQDLAEATARSAGAIQVALSRLRSVLQACIEQARRIAP
jgi:RNA polymerase sigma-70 factor (ECF subfamily)